MGPEVMTPFWLGYAFDVVLATVLVVVAWMCVVSPARLGAVLLFVCLGVLTALAWARLGAPDLALAEAILGAGVTGVLFVAAWSQSRDRTLLPAGRRRRLLALGLATIVTAIAGFAVWPLMTSSAGLAAAVAANVSQTGVGHPVTAVLVDFRSFDTLLELGVLLAALVATWRLGLERKAFAKPWRDAISLVYARVVAPGLVLVAGLLLWRGANEPGGAFQAGAALAAAGLLLVLVRDRLSMPAALVRVTAVLGVVAFAVLGAGALLATDHFLDWPDAHAGLFILLAEVGATLAIGITLVGLVIGPQSGAPKQANSVRPTHDAAGPHS